MKIIDKTLRVDIFVDINIFTKHLSKYLRVIISQLSLFCILKIINRIISSSINLIALAHIDSKYQNKVHGSAVAIKVTPRIYSLDWHDHQPQRLWVQIQAFLISLLERPLTYSWRKAPDVLIKKKPWRSQNFLSSGVNIESR